MAGNEPVADLPILPKLSKCPTGISGLDDVTGGGLPRHRLTLVCGGAGCGKTLFSLEFIIRGAMEFGEPGVVMSFDETAEELTQNVASLGFDLRTLVAEKKLAIVYVLINPQEQVSGHFDLEPLFVRLNYAIKSVAAKRLALDTLEAVFGNSFSEVTLRSEIQRLFRWTKDCGVTTIVTGERGRDQLTRHGLEEYISDCVISLDHRVVDQVTTRRLRVVKYRGTVHGTNEYPFIFGSNGISVLPVTSLALNHAASSERISTGVHRLDTMLGGQGFFRGSSVLLSGTAGTGKTTLAAHFVRAACERQERCLYFAFEEAPAQIQRNMTSVGVDLSQPVRAGLLTFEATRPSATGLEAHLLFMHQAVMAVKPSVVVVDPLNAFISGNNALEVKALLVRLIDFLKSHGITGLFTSLTGRGSEQEGTDTEVSSLIDTWLIVRDIEAHGERNRGLTILKSRGMAHSNQIREFKLTNDGIALCDVFVGEDGVLMGTARMAREAEEDFAQRRRSQEIERLERTLAEKERAFAAQTQALQAVYAADRNILRQAMEDLAEADTSRAKSHLVQARNRFADSSET